VDVDIVDLFKVRLLHEYVKYDYTAELTGPVDRSEYFNEGDG